MSLLESHKLASTSAVATVCTGVYGLMDRAPTMLSLIATSLGICLTIVLLIINVIKLRDRMRNVPGALDEGG